MANYFLHTNACASTQNHSGSIKSFHISHVEFVFTFNEILLLLILLFLLAEATDGATWEWFYVIIFDFDLSKSSDGLLKADGAGVSGD